MDHPLVSQLARAVSQHRLWPRGASLIAAVSGGPDSVALLHALAARASVTRLCVRVAHLDHGLRPAAAADAAFVRELAGALRVPAVIERIDVGARCRAEGWSLEDGARRVRYAFLAETAQRFGASHVVTAHTADDQAETVLMRLVQGAGLTGLAAMPWSRPLVPGVSLVRPLLDTWRTDVESYLRAHALTARQDASNADEAYLRNRIRRRLLPLLEREYNPNIKRLLTQLAEQAGHDSAFLREAAGRQWRRVAPDRSGVRLEVKAFRRQPKAIQRQLVREAVDRARGGPARLEFRHWRAVEALFAGASGGKLDLPGGVVLERAATQVLCRKAG